MSWSSRISHATRWRAGEWALLGEAWWELLRARLLLARQKTEGIIRTLQGEATAQVPSAEAPDGLVRAILRAVHLFPIPMLCMPQSIALIRMMQKRGQPCTLMMGARPTEQGLDAHAWVEQGGIPLNSPPDSAERHPVYLKVDF